MRKLFICFASLLSFSCFAASSTTTPDVSSTLMKASVSHCARAPTTSAPEFCAAFKSIAACHCLEHSMPPAACNDMRYIYSVMMKVYHNLPGACSPIAQQDTSQQECIDDWTFYNSHCL